MRLLFLFRLELQRTAVVDPDHVWTKARQVEHAYGRGIDRDTLEKIEMDSEIVRKRCLDQIGMCDNRHDFAWMVRRDEFELIHNARLHLAHRVAAWEVHATRIELHHAPQLMLGQLLQGLAGPIAVAYFAQPFANPDR